MEDLSNRRDFIKRAFSALFLSLLPSLTAEPKDPSRIVLSRKSTGNNFDKEVNPLRLYPGMVSLIKNRSSPALSGVVVSDGQSEKTYLIFEQNSKIFITPYAYTSQFSEGTIINPRYNQILPLNQAPNIGNNQINLGVTLGEPAAVKSVKIGEVEKWIPKEGLVLQLFKIQDKPYSFVSDDNSIYIVENPAEGYGLTENVLTINSPSFKLGKLEENVLK